MNNFRKLIGNERIKFLNDYYNCNLKPLKTKSGEIIAYVDNNFVLFLHKGLIKNYTIITNFKDLIKKEVEKGKYKFDLENEILIEFDDGAVFCSDKIYGDVLKSEIKKGVWK